MEVKFERGYISPDFKDTNPFTTRLRTVLTSSSDVSSRLNGVMSEYNKRREENDPYLNLFIQGLGELIKTENESPQLLQDIVHLASQLELWQLEPDIRSLKATPTYQDATSVLRKKVDTFYEYRLFAEENGLAPHELPECEWRDHGKPARSEDLSKPFRDFINSFELDDL